MTRQKPIGKKLALALLSLLCVFGMGQAAAATKLQSVAQAYASAGNLTPGMIVQPAASQKGAVSAAAIADSDKMIGVTVVGTKATATLAPTATSSPVYVANSGRYSVQVSDEDGPISVGDYVTISSLAGVGMKADAHENEVLGKALSSFNGVQNVNRTVNVHTQGGQQLQVAVGTVAVDIAIAPNPLALKASNVPTFLQHIGLLVTGKPVAPIRLYLGLALIILTTLVVGSLLYAGVRNGMVAVGRNPLAHHSIMGNLLEVVAASVVIFVIGLFGTYLLLKL